MIDSLHLKSKVDLLASSYVAGLFCHVALPAVIAGAGGFIVLCLGVAYYVFQKRELKKFELKTNQHAPLVNSVNRLSIGV